MALQKALDVINCVHGAIQSTTFVIVLSGKLLVSSSFLCTAVSWQVCVSNHQLSLKQPGFYYFVCKGSLAA